MVNLTQKGHADTRPKSGRVNSYLKIPPLLKDSDHGFVDVSDELMSLWFPQVVHAQLQLLYQGVLHSAARPGSMREKKETQSSQTGNNGYDYMLLYGAKHVIWRFCSGLNASTDLCVRSVLCTSVFLHGTLFFHIRADAHKCRPAHRERRWSFQTSESNIRASDSINMDFLPKRSHIIASVMFSF